MELRLEHGDRPLDVGRATAPTAAPSPSRSSSMIAPLMRAIA
jgi:hypothetical protein